MKKNYSNEELREALEYFEKVDALEKGANAEGFDTSVETNGGKEEKIALLKSQREEYLAKAKELEMKEETTPSQEETMEEMRKSLKTEILGELQGSYDELLKSRDTEILNLKEELESLKNEPLRKSKTTTREIDFLEKAFTGERTEDNNKVLSKKLHKGVISQILFEAWNRETDEVKKARYSDAVMQFESASGFISEEIKEDLVKSHNIQIID